MYEDKDKISFQRLVDLGSNELLVALMEGGGKAFRGRLHGLLTEAIVREKHNGWKRE